MAIVSLSSGMAGDAQFRHRYELGKKRLEDTFGLNVVAMSNALKGTRYLHRYPEARAQDLMDAFADSSINAVFSNIGGDDTIRLLPYIDFDVIRSNPKVFLGYSDTTANHFMMQKAGLVSFYGPSVICEFAENSAMHDYTVRAVKNTLFEGRVPLSIEPSPQWTSAFLDWTDEKNNSVARPLTDDKHSYELLQGEGIAQGHLLGGCVDVLPMIVGTSIWPALDRWKGAVLFLETSEEHPTPDAVRYVLLNLLAQGVLDVINGVIIGKPKDEKYYEEYKGMYTEFFAVQARRPTLPVLYNLNFGHTAPMCVLPLGVQACINCDTKRMTILERAVSDI